VTLARRVRGRKVIGTGTGIPSRAADLLQPLDGLVGHLLGLCLGRAFIRTQGTEAVHPLLTDRPALLVQVEPAQVVQLGARDGEGLLVESSSDTPPLPRPSQRIELVVSSDQAPQALGIDLRVSELIEGPVLHIAWLEGTQSTRRPTRVLPGPVLVATIPASGPTTPARRLRGLWTPRPIRPSHTVGRRLSVTAGIDRPTTALRAAPRRHASRVASRVAAGVLALVVPAVVVPDLAAGFVPTTLGTDDLARGCLRPGTLAPRQVDVAGRSAARGVSTLFAWGAFALRALLGRLRQVVIFALAATGAAALRCTVGTRLGAARAGPSSGIGIAGVAGVAGAVSAGVRGAAT
jgi:hypothetical protein